MHLLSSKCNTSDRRTAENSGVFLTLVLADLEIISALKEVLTVKHICKSKFNNRTKVLPHCQTKKKVTQELFKLEFYGICSINLKRKKAITKDCNHK